MKPILFNTDMVRAILEDRKTATRRAIKPQPDKEHSFKLGFCIDGDKKNIGKFGFGIGEDCGNIFYVKPPCKIGDILYVRETWSRLVKSNEDGVKTGKYVYKASDIYPFGEKYIVKFKWHPSIHMPRQAARIFLQVTDVRVERLQDITEVQAIHEGTPYEEWKPTYSDPDSGRTDQDFTNGFARLWDSTIKKADMVRYGWEANPWVWVIEFKRIEKPKKKRMFRKL